MRAWNLLWKLIGLTAGVVLLHTAAGFSIRQAAGVAASLWFILELARETRVPRLRMTIQLRWPAILNLLGVDPGKCPDIEDHVLFPQVTITRLERDLWFIGETGEFSPSPSFGQSVRVFGSLLEEPYLRWYQSDTGIRFVLNLPRKQLTEAGKAAVEQIEAAGYRIDETGLVEIAVLPYEAISLEVQDITKWGWVFFGRTEAGKQRAAVERAGWKEDSDYGWQCGLLSVVLHVIR